MKAQLVAIFIITPLVYLIMDSTAIAAETFQTSSTNLKNNPFVIPAYVNASQQSGDGSITPTEIKISGVLFSKNSSLIIVNDSVLGLYDEIEGYQLVRLNTRRAVFIKDGIETTLTLPDTMSEAKGR